MNYEVAIPSFHRTECLRVKTLPLLKRGGVPSNIIRVFVASEQEREAYRKALAPGAVREIVVAPAGIGATRNFIETYYPVGTKVMCFDDDLSDILRRVDDKTLKPLTNLVTELIERGFRACETYGAFLFGVNNVPNPFYMRNRISLELHYINGSAFGFIARHDRELFVHLDDKEDMERNILYYLKDGRIVRFDDLALKTRFYKEPGGLQDTRTEQRITESAVYLAKKYPWLVTLYVRRSTGHAELRFRDVTRSGLRRRTVRA
jgi:cold shock CspA family protein